jgi:hypothetical protein
MFSHAFAFDVILISVIAPRNHAASDSAFSTVPQRTESISSRLPDTHPDTHRTAIKLPTILIDHTIDHTIAIAAVGELRRCVRTEEPPFVEIDKLGTGGTEFDPGSTKVECTCLSASVLDER